MCRWENPKDPTIEMLLLHAWNGFGHKNAMGPPRVNSIVSDAGSGQKTSYPKTNAKAKKPLKPSRAIRKLGPTRSKPAATIYEIGSSLLSH